MTTLTSFEFLSQAKRAQFLVVDTEGDGKDVRDPNSGAITMGVTLTFRDDNFDVQSKYFPFFHIVGENVLEFFEEVKALIESHPRLVFHHVKHDRPALKLWGIDLRKGFYCTMLMLHLIDENRRSYSLDDASRSYGGEPKAMTKGMAAIIKILGWSHVSTDQMIPYSEQDGIITLELFEKIWPTFLAEELDGPYWRDEEEWVITLNDMESWGVKIDKELCEREIAKGEKRMEEIVAQLGGRRPSSPKDLEQLLLVDLKLPVFKRSAKTGKPSFDKQAMKLYDVLLKRSKSPVANLVTEFRGWQKVVSTNYKPYLRLAGNDGRLRPNYMLHRAVTRRLTCGSDSDGKRAVNSPNLQNIPRVSEREWDGFLKSAFISEDGYELWEFDYGQLELRIGAAYSKDPKLLEIFQNGKHIFRTMEQEFGYRWPYHSIKTFVYATGYNAQDDKVASILGISPTEARDLRLAFNHTYVDYVKCKNKVARIASQRLYIKYWTGSRRHFQDWKEARHKAFNSLMQGGGAELVKLRANAVRKAIDWDSCRMLLQIHDSLVFEIRKDKVDYWKPIIKGIMEDVPAPLGTRVPFTVEAKLWGT